MSDDYKKARKYLEPLANKLPWVNFVLSLIPKKVVWVKREDVSSWYSEHKHDGKRMGAIGGKFTITSTVTSIGNLESVMCNVCKTEMNIEDEW